MGEADSEHNKTVRAWLSREGTLNCNDEEFEKLTKTSIWKHLVAIEFSGHCSSEDRWDRNFTVIGIWFNETKV